jgi:hypothetical protein
VHQAGKIGAEHKCGPHAPGDVDSYDPSQHGEFRELIEGRLKIEIQYESIYGGERFTFVYPRDRDLIAAREVPRLSAWE